jgi:DNA ligase (NAD+)
MTFTPTPLARAAALRTVLNEANLAYHAGETSPLSDADYDQLFAELQQLETTHPDLRRPDSPTQKVGAAVPRTVTVPHRVPMLSLDNVFTLEGALKFAQKIQDEYPHAEFTVEYKVDGISLALIYENSRLVAALTRGDGESGEDVTHAARAMRGVPLSLTNGVPPGRIEIRGEAYIDPADFERIRHENGQILANPRNAAVGAVKSLDPQVTWRRKIRFVMHGLGALDNNPWPFYTHWITWAGSNQIWACLFGSVTRVQDLEQRLQAAIRLAPDLPFPTDGLVIKVDNLDLREKLGVTHHHVRWAIAYKWEEITRVTRLASVTLQVGRSGVITPVAELEPVEIDQTMVARASLHNFSEIKRLDLHHGDTVVVQKAGKIIPQVLRVLPELRLAQALPVTAPTTCPACASPTVADGEYLKCSNLDCPAAKLQQLVWYVSKDGLDIDGLGDVFVEQLYEAGFLSDVGDLYRLAANEESIVEKTDIGPNRMQNILIAIERSKQAPLHKLLTALGIDGVGVGTAKALAERFGSMQRLVETAKNPVALQGPGIGQKAAAAISQFFVLSTTQELLELFKTHGVNLARSSAQTTSQRLAGQIVLVTGTCSRPREEVQQLVEQHGGTFAKGFSKKVTLLVVGESPGSKLAKAKAAGTRIVPAEDFLTDLLG